MSISVKVLIVSDLHRNRNLYASLHQATEEQSPDIVAVVGDFLDAGDNTESKLSTEECARALGHLPCPEVIFVRGNHEDSSWWTFADAWGHPGKELIILEGGTFTYGPLLIVGFPCLMLHGDGMGADLPADPDKWLPKLLRPFGPASRTLWLMHEPPIGTPLSESSGPLIGNVEWREAIDRFSPWLVVFGHDHNTPKRVNKWHCKLGASTCVNVGQSNAGPLRYTVVDMTFPANTPSLPKSLQITAYPQAQSTKLP